MNRITLWYASLNRRTKTAITVIGAAVAVAVCILVIYMIVTPGKVEVRYGTIVRDPIDGHIWEDNTQTAWVDPDEACNYRVEYVDKLSEEHAQQLAEQEAQEAEEQAMLEESQGLEVITTSMPTEQMQDLETLQQNIEVMGHDVITGLEMASELSETKNILIDYRNQVAAMQLPPELEPLRQEALAIFDKYIAACDLYLQAIATGDMSYTDQANALIEEASAMMQDLIPTY